MPLSRLDFERMIEKQGRQITLTRLGSPNITATLKAHVRRGRNAPSSDMLTGGMVEDVAMVICSTKELSGVGWDGPPQPPDRIQFDGEQHLVRTTYKLYISEVLVGYRIQVQG